jgi:hypothetical protein
VIAGLDPAIHLFRKGGSPDHGVLRRPGDDAELIGRISYDTPRYGKRAAHSSTFVQLASIGL